MSEFDKWLKQLDMIFEKQGLSNTVEKTGKDCWKTYFDDGYTPQEALIEDASYGW